MSVENELNIEERLEKIFALMDKLDILIGIGGECFVFTDNKAYSIVYKDDNYSIDSFPPSYEYKLKLVKDTAIGRF